MTGHDRILSILAFEPFDTGSHRAVRLSITDNSRHRWTWLTRPGRAWKWRMRLAALELVDEARATGAFRQPIDAVFATSLLSVPDLVAALPSPLRAKPVILYMHENQAAYPPGREAPKTAERDAHFALTNLASVLCADLVIFNSEWNRRSLINGIAALLAHAPDRELKDVAARIEERSTVIWPPVEPPPQALRDRHTGNDVDSSSEPPIPAERGGSRVLHNPVRVVWPHRWEHDKGPEELLAMAEAHTEPLNLRWTILGQQFRETPPALQRFRQRFADRIDHIGYAKSRDDYWRLLTACDWVLSTADHEFFGIAVVEALFAGCLPWLPDRLSYPELLPPIARGLSPARRPDDPDAIRVAIRAHLKPALAMNAVQRLDDAIASIVESTHEVADAGSSNSGS
jgi:glycosyltransferase involved in cell wall biosynthesis